MGGLKLTVFPFSGHPDCMPGKGFGMDFKGQGARFFFFLKEQYFFFKCVLSVKKNLKIHRRPKKRRDDREFVLCAS